MVNTQGDLTFLNLNVDCTLLKKLILPLKYLSVGGNIFQPYFNEKGKILAFGQIACHLMHFGLYIQMHQ